MDILAPFIIDLKHLESDNVSLSLPIDDAFFAAVEGEAIEGGALVAQVTVRKTANFFTLTLHCEGVVRVPCDVCLEAVEESVAADSTFTVKYGNAYSDNDDLITIDETDGTLNVSWLLYEAIALALPIKHVHAPGKCNPAMIQALSEHSAARSSDGGEEGNTSAWSILKQLKN